MFFLERDVENRGIVKLFRAITPAGTIPAPPVVRLWRLVEGLNVFPPGDVARGIRAEQKRLELAGCVDAYHQLLRFGRTQERARAEVPSLFGLGMNDIQVFTLEYGDASLTSVTPVTDAFYVDLSHRVVEDHVDLRVALSLSGLRERVRGRHPSGIQGLLAETCVLLREHTRTHLHVFVHGSDPFEEHVALECLRVGMEHWRGSKVGYRVDLRFLSRVLSGFFDLERDHVIAGVAAEVRAGGRLVDWAGLGDGGVVLSVWSVKLVGRRLVAAVNRAGELIPAALNEGAGEEVVRW